MKVIGIDGVSIAGDGTIPFRGEVCWVTKMHGFVLDKVEVVQHLMMLDAALALMTLYAVHVACIGKACIPVGCVVTPHSMLCWLSDCSIIVCVHCGNDMRAVYLVLSQSLMPE